MSIESFVQAMPKVELHIHLEGALQKDRLILIAEQNEVPDTLKHFNQWAALLDAPEYDRLDEIVDTTTQWLQHPDDLIHVTYELGVALARQNVRYAEISVDPIRFTEKGWTFEQFMAALNDGRSRAERGWGVQMRWVLTIARNQPRHADEIVRWASGSGHNLGVVRVELGGPERAQPVGQFERAFRTAAKKQLPRSVYAGKDTSVEELEQTLEHLEPTQLVDAWGIAEAPELRQLVIDGSIPVTLSLYRALRHGWIDNLSEHPLRSLYDDGVTLVLGSGMPSYYQSNLTDEYAAAVEQAGLEVEELEEIALNAIRASQMTAAEKTAMVETFRQEYQQLREQHLSEQTSE